MEEIMQSNAFFMVPLTSAYLAICLLWFWLDKRGKSWRIEPIPAPLGPWLEFGLGLLVCLAVIGIGQLFSAGFLIPKARHTLLNQLVVWPMNNVIIYSPIFLVLLIRKQIQKQSSSLGMAFLENWDLAWWLRSLVFSSSQESEANGHASRKFLLRPSRWNPCRISRRFSSKM